MTDTPDHHILSVLVENKAGVLARVASMFARRGFNIYSLAVAPTEEERYSRLTIVVDADPVKLSVLEVTEFIYAISLAACDRKEERHGETVRIGVLFQSGREPHVT